MKSKTVGQQLVRALEELNRDLQEGRPLKVTTVIIVHVPKSMRRERAKLRVRTKKEIGREH